MKIKRKDLKKLIEKTILRHDLAFDMLLESEQKENIDSMSKDEMINSLNKLISSGNYDHAMLILDSFPSLKNNPKLKVWSAVNHDADYEVIASNLTQKEALSVQFHSGERVYTKGETTKPGGTSYKYYLQFPGWGSIVNLKR